MGFLEKISENIFHLHIYVKPNSKNQRIYNNLNHLIISLQSKPVQNKANKELIKLLKKKLKISTNQIQIISGAKSSTKLIKLSFTQNINEQKLKSLLLKRF